MELGPIIEKRRNLLVRIIGEKLPIYPRVRLSPVFIGGFQGFIPPKQSSKPPQVEI